MTNQDDIPEIFRQNDSLNSEKQSVFDIKSEYGAAMQVIAELSGAYVLQTEQALQKALELTQKAKQCSSLSEKDTLMKKEVFRLVHDIKGQGATFGYPLMTDIGNKLCRYLESRKEFTDMTLEKVRRHLLLLTRILENQVMETTSEKATEILNEMKKIETEEA